MTKIKIFTLASQVLRRWRQEDSKFQATLVYRFLDIQASLSYIARPWLKKQTLRQTDRQSDKQRFRDLFLIYKYSILLIL